MRNMTLLISCYNPPWKGHTRVHQISEVESISLETEGFFFKPICLPFAGAPQSDVHRRGVSPIPSTMSLVRRPLTVVSHWPTGSNCGDQPIVCLIRSDSLGSILSSLEEQDPLPEPSQALRLPIIWVAVLNLGKHSGEETKFVKLFITSARKITHFRKDSIPNLYRLHNLLLYLLNSNTCCGQMHEIILHFLANIKSQNSLGLWHGSYFVHRLRSKTT